MGDVSAHVPNPVTAGMALLVAGRVLGPGRRVGAGVGGVVDGGGIGDRTGDFWLHDVAGLLLPVVGLLLLAAPVLPVVRHSGGAPWPVRVAALASVPGTLALDEASSGLWLAAGLVAAGAWLVVAVHAAGRPARAVAVVAAA